MDIQADLEGETKSIENVGHDENRKRGSRGLYSVANHLKECTQHDGLYPEHKLKSIFSPRNLECLSKAEFIGQVYIGYSTDKKTL